MDFDYTTETITPEITNLLTVGGTGAFELPYGTTLERPVTGLDNGAIRYNTDLSVIEGYVANSWNPLATGSTSITLTGDVTGTGTSPVTTTLATVNANVGTFAVTTVNGKGLVTAASNLTGDVTSAGGATTLATVNADVGTFSALTVNGKGLVTAATNLSATGDATGTASGSGITLTLATINSDVGQFAVGTYNGKGLTTSATNISGDATTAGAVLTLATVNASPQANTFRKITVNGKGLVTATTAVVTGDITTALGYTPVNRAGDTMTGNLVLNADPSVALGAATKQYVDAAIAGLSWKQAVNVATTTDGTFATAYAAGQVIDGVTLIAGDRILIKDQTDKTQNGIYDVQSSGVPIRSNDANLGSELITASVHVDAGTLNADSGWVQTTNAPITLGTSNIVWAQFSGSGSYVAGTGLTLTGNTFSLSAPVAPALGGTGTSTIPTSGQILYSSAGTSYVPSTLSSLAVTTFSTGSTGLTPSAATSGAVTLAGTLVAANGGTGNSSYAVGDLLYASAATTLSKLADVSVGSYLRSGGVTTAPIWSTVKLPNAATTGDIMYASAANTYNNLPDVAVGSVLLSGGVGVAPSYGKVSLSTAITGVLPVANGGTALSAAPTSGQLLIGNGTGYTLAGLTGTTNQVTVTGGAGSITLSTPATFVAPGSIASTSSITAATGLTVTAGGALVSAGGVTISTLTANSFLYSGTAGLLTSTIAPTNGQLLIGSTGASPVLGTISAGIGISVTPGAGTITIAAVNNGTVSSVGLSLPSIFTVTGSPVTTTGTLTGALATQSANVVFAGPVSAGAAVPTFRSLVAADINTALLLYRENPSTSTTPLVAGTNAVSIGSGSSAAGNNSVAIGTGASAIAANTQAFANGQFTGLGDAQTLTFVARNITTNATPAKLFVDGSSQLITLPNNSAWTFTIRVVGRRTDATGGSAMYSFQGGITRDATAATTTLQGSSRTVINKTDGAWNCTISADTTGGALSINVTGQAAKTIRWVATIEITQVTN